MVEEPQGTRRIYRLHDEGVEAVEAYLAQVWGDAVDAVPPDGREHDAAARVAPPVVTRAAPAERTEIDCPADARLRRCGRRACRRWWPKGHSASGDPDAVVTLEPRLGGRIFERTPDGAEIDWGEITAWDPPHRLGYLWHIGRDPRRRHRRRAHLRRRRRRHHPARDRALGMGAPRCRRCAIPARANTAGWDGACSRRSATAAEA